MSANTNNTVLIRCLAIDDEPLARTQLESFIERTPYLTLTASCADAFEAMQYINEGQVDAIFVDINMPDLNGMEFVQSLKNPPLIVFTTAYSQYALEGYKVNAIDYLLKPFGMSEFQKAAAKVKEQFDLRNPVADNTEEGVLYLKVDYHVMRVEIKNIRYIESMREYLRIYLVSGEKFMTLMPISRMATELQKYNFVRIHRSFLVNMKNVVEVSKMEVRLDNKETLPIGESFKEELKKFISGRVMM